MKNTIPVFLLRVLVFLPAQFFKELGNFLREIIFLNSTFISVYDRPSKKKKKKEDRYLLCYDEPYTFNAFVIDSQ